MLPSRLRFARPFMSRTFVSLQNVNTRDISQSDHLFHLGLSSDADLSTMFGDVQFFCTGGSASRIRHLARKLANELPSDVTGIPFGASPSPIGSTDRYEMYKVGPVLLVNHGMGVPSTSILLHEITKLLSHAGVRDPAYIRLGTSGGIGVEPGTVVITTEAVDGLLEPSYKLPILGKLVERPTVLDAELAEAIVKANEESATPIPLDRGRTMATDCFYEGQGRLDGAICNYMEEDKMKFLEKAHEKGVRNIEMEATVFSAFTNHLGIRAAVCCVALLDRLQGDQHPFPKETLEMWDERPGDLLVNYIKKCCKIN
eukprot:g4385.t1